MTLKEKEEAPKKLRRTSELIRARKWAYRYLELWTYEWDRIISSLNNE
jgi:hypothetical protein